LETASGKGEQLFADNPVNSVVAELAFIDVEDRMVHRVF
jgi:hypothetical protein